uniref:Uncharacterized protein n=1 Tax=viral metagenome TaxID=1070528 RepID=A0A6C0D7Z7_9ZZZZ
MNIPIIKNKKLINKKNNIKQIIILKRLFVIFMFKSYPNININ